MKPPKHLLHSEDDEIGYHRKRYYKGFRYTDEKGHHIKNAALVARLNRIGIPPAWGQVWICKEENGCLQASGRDEKGRKQYIYHPDWALYRNLDKFESLYRFGEDLGKIRNQIWQDIALTGWPKEKVIALAIAILDETYVRVGNRYYCDTNQTYGLTTLRRKHLQVNSTGITLSYKAKWGKALTIKIEQRNLCKLIKACADLPGHELFCYLEESKKSHPITSQDINHYLQLVTGEDYTAKNFRTWGGSVSALEVLPAAQQEVLAKPRSKLINIVVAKVSQILCNTMPICRKYYIHPAILSAIENAKTEFFCDQAQKEKGFPELDHYEKQLMLILKAYYS